MEAGMVSTVEHQAAVVLTFSNGWKPGEVRIQHVRSNTEAVQLLADTRWCFVPDESSDEAMVADRDMLVDQLDCGSPAWLMEPVSGDMVHIRPIALTS
jgi:hypothetical protein